MTVLVLTNRRDLTTDYIVRELVRRNISFVRLNTETLASCKLELDPTAGRFDIAFEGKVIHLSDVRAAYFRRPDQPLRPSESVSPADWQYALGEWNAILKSIYLFVGARWLSHPSDIMLAEDKPRQLMIAARLGLRLPETRVTNDLSALSRMDISSQLVGKPLKSALLQDEEDDRVVFTSRVVPTEADRSAMALAPVIYQAEIVKQSDVRVTVVGTRVFAVAIHSQELEGTQVDWRKGSVPDLRHEPIDLPADIEAKCVEVVQSLNLRFGAIDLILDREGRFWFLECNPNGQWAWIENRTGLPICAAIVDEIERVARC